MKAIAVLLCLALATTAVSGQADPFSFIPNTNAVALAGFKASEALAGGDCSAIDALGQTCLSSIVVYATADLKFLTVPAAALNGNAECLKYALFFPGPVTGTSLTFRFLADPDQTATGELTSTLDLTVDAAQCKASFELTKGSIMGVVNSGVELPSAEQTQLDAFVSNVQGLKDALASLNGGEGGEGGYGGEGEGGGNGGGAIDFGNLGFIVGIVIALILIVLGFATLFF